jgi:maleamate amidohydrolase
MPERVWDKFLTEQDKLHVEKQGGRAGGFGDRPALLMIDLYRWVFGDRPQPLAEAVKEWPGSCGLSAWEALPHIQALLAAARDADIPVVHVTGLHESESGVRPWARPRRRREVATDPAMENRRARMFDIVDELAPVPGEALVRKASPSAFFGTPLVAHLNAMGVNTLIVAGESTSGCVRASVVDGCTYRYRMVIVEECVFDRHEAAHAINLFDMSQKYADVVSLVETTNWMRSWRTPGRGVGETVTAESR